MLEVMSNIRIFSRRFGRSWKNLSKQTMIEQLHRDYKRSLTRNKRWVHFFQIIIFLTFFVLWEIASRFHWIDPLIFSSPSKVWELLKENILDGSIFPHIWTTVFETILGFIIGTVAVQSWLRFFGGHRFCQRFWIHT